MGSVSVETSIKITEKAPEMKHKLIHVASQLLFIAVPTNTENSKYFL